MARVLAAGGFPDEALPLVAKAIGIGAAARLAALGELAAGATMATPAQMRDLVDRGVLAAAGGDGAVGALVGCRRQPLPTSHRSSRWRALVIAGLDDGQIATAA